MAHFLQIQVNRIAISQFHPPADDSRAPIHLQLSSRTEGISFALTLRLAGDSFICHQQDNELSAWNDLCSLTETQDEPLKAYLSGHDRIKCRVAIADAPPLCDGFSVLELRFEEDSYLRYAKRNTVSCTKLIRYTHISYIINGYLNI
jgi:hypothetical protein